MTVFAGKTDLSPDRVLMLSKIMPDRVAHLPIAALIDLVNLARSIHQVHPESEWPNTGVGFRYEEHWVPDKGPADHFTNDDFGEPGT